MHITQKRCHLHSANPDPSTLTNYSCLSSKRVLRAITIFIICMFALTLHVHGRSTKEKRHQLVLDGLAWADITPSQRCLSFGIREYSAQLMGVRKGEDGLRWCKEKSIIIHGFNIEKPGYCIINVDNSVPTNLQILGNWMVDFNKLRCKTLSENFQDKGCVVIVVGTEAHMGLNHELP
ncbi:hypothetical protein ARMGADRAFT_1087672 [Armillaria gallica]|uniref:Uncharacterized protein n=1 Tax=Armillaria gallica TaxID=47427 RepID=A0A2H3DCM2_ARMGA|nr:hypothetical protein ARMGADRAFT_1087672 [Armillaria gallica]